MWFSVIKMPPNPHGGTWSELSREEYYQMDDRNKELYHAAQSTVMQKILNELRMRLSNESDLNRKSPMLEELKVLQLKRNFHARQASRIGTELENYYSREDEGENKRINRLTTRPEGTKLEDLTEKEYNDSSRKGKINYHQRMKNPYGAPLTLTKKKGHSREMVRMINDPNYIAPFDPSESRWGIIYTKEQYEQMTQAEQMKYHSRMALRASRSGDIKLKRFYSRMYDRFKKGGSLPTFYSPEDEQ